MLVFCSWVSLLFCLQDGKHVSVCLTVGFLLDFYAHTLDCSG